GQLAEFRDVLPYVRFLNHSEGARMKREHFPFSISVPDPSARALHTNHGSKQVLRNILGQRPASQNDDFVLAILEVNGNWVVLAADFYRDSLEYPSLIHWAEFQPRRTVPPGKPKYLAPYGIYQDAFGIVLQQTPVYVLCSLLSLFGSFV